MFPVRCFHCNKVFLGKHTNGWIEKCADKQPPYQVLDDLKITRPCCRSIFLSTESPMGSLERVILPQKWKKKQNKVE